MSIIKISKINELTTKHVNKHTNYEYDKKHFISRGEANNCIVNVYEIPPKKSAYPYHYHHNVEEVFYIIEGVGELKTPEGIKKVTKGDLLFFPSNPSGAHKLTNTSENEKLIYIDFDTVNNLDVTIYPDSNKIGVWGKDINKVYKLDKDTDYYDGE